MSYKEYFRSDNETPNSKRIKVFDVKEEEEEKVFSITDNVEEDNFKSRLELVVGHLSSSQLETLRTKSDENVERAVNFYFDISGSSNNSTTFSPVESTNHSKISSPAKSEIAKDDATVDEEVQTEFQGLEHSKAESLGLTKKWSRRHIGSFQAEIWATRSGFDLVQFEERLKIYRRPPDPSKRIPSRGPPQDDFIVRVKNSRNDEVARLSDQDAKMVSILLDSKVCQFEATCIFTDSHLRIGDNVIVQVDCYMLKSAFYRDLAASYSTRGSDFARRADANASITFFDNSRETLEEKIMRQRQVGLVKLFAKLDLTPESALPALDTNNMAKASGMMGTQVSTHASSESSSENEDDADVDQDQLDSLYKRNEAPDLHLEEVEPPHDTFNLELRPYQKKGLNWMIQKETSSEEANSVVDEPMHPLWQAVPWPSQKLSERENKNVDEDSPAEYDTDANFYVNLYSGDLSLDFPKQEKTLLGGILADEMGLGKTISTMALVHSCRYSPRPNVQEQEDFAKHTTLVVAPMSLLSQWESEVYASSKPGTIRALMYYGNSARSNLKSILCENVDPDEVPNVVITSYGTLIAEHGQLMKYRQGKSKDENWEDDPSLSLFGLYGVKFYRVVLDEGHTIKNRNTKTSKSCYDLRAERRWVLTGTPIVNKLEDLFSLVKFLRVEPWNNFSFWKAFITTPFQSKGYVQALKVVQSILEPLVLRRTKDMKQADGTPLVKLPPKTVSIQRVKFTDDEQALYSWIFARVQSSFNHSLAAGSLMKSYTTILAQIMRLRQVCCHPTLVSQAAAFKSNDDLEEVSGSNGMTILNIQDQDLRMMLEKFENPQAEEYELQSYGTEVMKSILEGAEHECPICTTEPIAVDQQAVTECWHMSCLDCILSHIEFQKNKGDIPRCHICRETISSDRIYQVHRIPQADGEENVTLRRYRGRGQSAKVRALLSQLKQVHHDDIMVGKNTSSTKTVIFSQFTSFLDLIERELVHEGFTLLRFDGTLNQRQRSDVLNSFTNDKQYSILLISLKAGGVGLNLVCANRAYLMDPWWSYAVEAQAIDRIHRMGQLSEVQVTRFIVEGTVEERMLKIQERKKFLASTLGMSEEEKRAQRMEDIKSLFEE